MRRIGKLGMVSVFGRHLVGSKARVERGNLFLRFDLRLAGRDVLAGEDRLAGGDIGLSVDANTEKQAQRHQRRFGDGGIHTQWPKIIAKLFIAGLRS